MASLLGGLSFSVVLKHMRQCGGAVWQDVLAAVVAYVSSVSDEDNEAWVVYKKAKEQATWGEKRGDAEDERGKGYREMIRHRAGLIARPGFR